MTTETQALNQQVQRRLRRERHARLVRGVLLTLVVTVAMVLLAVSNRDQQAYKNTRRIMDTLATHIEEDPLLKKVQFDNKWVLNRGYQATAAERGEAGVCARPVHMFFWTDGWHVLLYRDGEFNVAWLTDEEFKRRGPVLGLHRE